MPSIPNRKPMLALFGVLSVAILAYSLIIVQQILLGLIVAVVPWFLYLVVRFIFTLERIATALERLASVQTREQESTGSAGDSQRPSASYERDRETEGGVENE